MKPDYTIAAPKNAATVNVAYTTTATTPVISNASVIRVVTTSDAFIEISADSAVTAVATTGMFMPALTPEYFSCGSTVYVAAVQNTTGGTVYVTPVE